MSRFLPVLLLSLALAGCHLQPELGPPGTIGNQRTRAVLNDPFPNGELGPPFKGARPRGFDLPEPRAEGLQKYAPSQYAAPVNPFQAPQQIVPVQPVPTAMVPNQVIPRQVTPIQHAPIQASPLPPGFQQRY